MAEDSKEQDRRNHPRLAGIRGFLLYKSQRDPPETKQVLINDISAEGLCCDGLEKMDLGERLEGEICRSFGYQKNIITPISFLGEIVWARKINNKVRSGCNEYRFGLKFIEILAAEKEAIKKNVRFFYPEKNQ